MSDDYAVDNPEGSGSNQYVTRRDIRVVIIGVAVLFALLTPVYYFFKGETEITLCTRNNEAIGKAIQAYAADNNDQLPPAYERARPGSVDPLLIQGLPYPWASTIQLYFPARASFLCPSADPDEATLCYGRGGKKKPIQLTYGMVLGLEFMPVNRIEEPDQTILIAETANKNVFNPKPLAGGQDGFLIGYDTGNDLSPETLSTATKMTRLAFPGTSSGDFGSESGRRHRHGIRVLYASGRVGWLLPSGAVVERGMDGRLLAPWRAPRRDPRRGF